VGRKLGERIGRGAAAHFATGTGTGQPQGLTKATNLLTLPGVAPTYEALVDLEHSIDPAYRANARYIVHDSFLRELRKLKDTTGRPLWVPALAGGVPSTINGQPYTVDNSLPVFAAGAKSVVYGDIAQAYLIRQVAGAQTMRLDERYADFLQVGFLGFMRMDAKIQNQAAVAVLAAKAGS
jgi:HK97 family phage major capsid protein